VQTPSQNARKVQNNPNEKFEISRLKRINFLNVTELALRSNQADAPFMIERCNPQQITTPLNSSEFWQIAFM
jgi:hypothetical protein